MLILVGVLVIIFVIVFPIITIAIYNGEFGHRYEERRYESYCIDDFPGLEVEECKITANKGHKLAGYKYSRKGHTPKALFVMVHGLCGSHRNYMDLCDYFVSHDYAVFSYDATGSGESEGTKVGAFAQGLADLDYVLNYVKALPEYKDFPIVLMGHSWGGFCVCNVLNFHPDVKAVVSVSGFDTSATLLKQYTEVQIGKAATLLMPYARLYERIFWGKYAKTSACAGFANTDAKIMVIHSTDDPTVYASSGYDRYYEKFGQNDRFIFKLYNDRAHSYPVNSDSGRVCRTKHKEAYFKVKEEAGEAAALEYTLKNRDRTGCMDLDEPLMQEILEMFESVI